MREGTFGNVWQSRLVKAPQLDPSVGRISVTKMRMVQESIESCIHSLPKSLAPIARHLQMAWLGLDHVRESEAEREGEWQPPLLQ